MKVVFMGTPDFAVGALEAIIEAGHQVTAVVTQPDKPKGRGKEMQKTPVKVCAQKYGIPVFQPVKVKEPEAVETLRSYEADIFVVAAFGQILSQEILDIPSFGCLNIHASLLPKYRGASPIQHVILDGEERTGITIMQMDAGIDIINGEKITGVTIMQMDKGLDTGDMLFQSEVEIASDETADTLHDKLAEAGARLIVEALEKIEAGSVKPVKQNDEESCYAKMLQKSMGKIDWQMEAGKLDCLIRGLISWPGASTVYRGKNLKIWREEVVLEQELAALEAQTGQSDGGCAGNGKPGTVVQVDKDAVYVQTGDGLLRILEVQPEGKKRMAVRDFLLGYPVKAGDVFEMSSR